MWYLFATWLVISSISCSLSRSWWMRQTLSIQSSDSRVIFVSVLYPRFLCFDILAISSIRVAYYIIDSTLPCLMLSLMLIFLVSSYLIWILVVRFESSVFIILRVFPSTPLVFKAYSIASSQALSYVFVRLGKLCMKYVSSYFLKRLFEDYWVVTYGASWFATCLCIGNCDLFFHSFIDNYFVYFPDITG